MKTSSKKQKGRRLQQWVAARIAAILGMKVEKDGDIESRPMGQSGPDVILRGRAIELFPFSVETKNAERWDILSAIKQAKSNAKPGVSWLVILKKNNMAPIAILDAELFFEIYGKTISSDEVH